MPWPLYALLFNLNPILLSNIVIISLLIYWSSTNLCDLPKVNGRSMIQNPIWLTSWHEFFQGYHVPCMLLFNRNTPGNHDVIQMSFNMQHHPWEYLGFFLRFAHTYRVTFSSWMTFSIFPVSRSAKVLACCKRKRKQYKRSEAS